MVPIQVDALGLQSAGEMETLSAGELVLETENWMAPLPMVGLMAYSPVAK